MSINPPPSLIQALGYCLRPLVRMCIDHGIDYRMFSDLLKETYVSVADEDFSIPGRRQTDSRISLISGVHRKDVHAFREGPARSPGSYGGNRFANSLIAMWLEIPELSENNYPLPIPRTPKEGHAWSFADLASKVNRDMPARSLLDELAFKGVLKVDLNDMVHLDPLALIPARNIDQKAHYFGQGIHDHILAASEYLKDTNPRNLDAYVHFDGLSLDNAEKLRLVAETAAKKALKTVTDSAKALKNESSDQSELRSARISFGTYFTK